jgi:hypothetical protein
MIQIILTVIIVVVALGSGIYLTIRSLHNPLRACKGCEKNCGGCALEDLKKEIEKKNTKNKM